MNPSISCIIPTLNRGPVLVETLRQLLAQEPPATEIIVLDQTAQVDAATETALKEWHDQGEIKWLRQLEPNASKARNAGALAASSDILLFLDDDIQVAPNFAAAHAANYADPKVVSVAGQVLETERIVTSELRFPPEDPDLGWIRFPKNYSRRCVTSWVASGNFSIRRETYFEVGGMDENYRRGAFREETDFAMRFLAKGYRFQFDPNASILHLGVRIVPRGGARSWKNPFEFHHYVGDWYFNLRYLRWRNSGQLLLYSIRHLVASRKRVLRPWLMLISAVSWVVAIPVAAYLRMGTPRLVLQPP
jgi:GT2 family glycosyltransferase